MIEETGQVVAVDGDRVRVRAASRDGCRLCAEGRGCGGGLIGKLVGDRLATVEAVRGDTTLSVGDRVRLGLAGNSLVAAAGVVYLVPLAGFLGALLLSHALRPAAGTLWTLAAGLLGLTVGVVVARSLARRGRRVAWKPRVLGRMSGSEARCG